MKKLFDIFWRAPGARSILVTCCIVLAGFSEMIGMGALVPVADQLSSTKSAGSSILGGFILHSFAAVHIEPSFINLLLLVGFALVMKSLIAFLAMAYVAVSVSNVTTTLRTKLLDSVMNARWSYFTDYRPGQLSAMISMQATVAGDAYYATAQLVATVLSGVGLMFTAFLVSGGLVIYCLFATSFLAFPLYYILKQAEKSAAKQWSTANDLSSGVQDVLGNMKPLKSMARQRPFMRSFSEGIMQLRKAMIVMVVSRHAIYHGQDILGAVMVILGVFVGVAILKTPLSEMLVIGIIFYQVVDVIKRAQLHLQGATIAASAYYGLIDTISQSDRQLEPVVGTITPSLTTSISFDHVDFAYGETQVLRDATLECLAGKITVLIGPSGAGKTTVMDLIIGFYLPTKGTVAVDGVPINQISLAQWRQQIGYVPQELTLLKGTIRSNVTMADDTISDAAVHEALRLAGAKEFVAALPAGIHTDIGTMGAKLSGGQRQRISLARALVLQPKLLLLDEVTSALDDVTEAEICRNIQELAGKFTIIAITHRPAWTTIAARLYRVAEGRVELVV